MSIIDKALEANRKYARGYDPSLGRRPAPKLAVVTCMDPRLSDLPAILGLPNADLDVIRTGGPAVTEDVLGELVGDELTDVHLGLFGTAPDVRREDDVG